MLNSAGSPSEPPGRHGRPMLSQLKAAFVRSLDYTSIRKDKHATVVRTGELGVGRRRREVTLLSLGGASGENGKLCCTARHDECRRRVVGACLVRANSGDRHKEPWEC